MDPEPTLVIPGLKVGEFHLKLNASSMQGTMQQIFTPRQCNYTNVPTRMMSNSGRKQRKPEGSLHNHGANTRRTCKAPHRQGFWFWEAVMLHSILPLRYYIQSVCTNSFQLIPQCGHPIHGHSPHFWVSLSDANIVKSTWLPKAQAENKVLLLPLISALYESSCFISINTLQTVCWLNYCKQKIHKAIYVFPIL